MENISANELADRLLGCCLNGQPWPEDWLDRLCEADASGALLRVVVEGLADLFEPRLSAIYAEMFSGIIGRVIHAVHGPHLAERYRRITKPRMLSHDPAAVRSVFVLSRVTLGADVAVTSVVLDAAKRRFPEAEIYYVGPRKGWELFAGDRRLKHLSISYGRGGTLVERLSTWPELRAALTHPRSIIVDPDSRLTQLGLLPVCPEADYYFFESRSYGGSSAEALPALTRRWVSETFGVDGTAFIHPEPEDFSPPDVTVSLGVGENPAKRIGDRFEEELLRFLADRGHTVLVDKGAGGEEAERVERAVHSAGGAIKMWDGSFAGFAARIARSKLYVGYDSAGGHVAAACAVPQVSIFAGEPCERMFERWRPSGHDRIRIVRHDYLRETLRAIDELLG